MGGTIDGWVTEIWMRSPGQWIETDTTVRSTFVSVHLIGDGNDGRADVHVDGVLVTSLDMCSVPTADRAFVLVKRFPNTTHHIEVHAVGGSQQPGPCGGHDVATLGAAALAIKLEGIPTASAWGLGVLTLALLVAAKIYFNRGRAPLA